MACTLAVELDFERTQVVLFLHCCSGLIRLPIVGFGPVPARLYSAAVVNVGSSATPSSVVAPIVGFFALVPFILGFVAGSASPNFLDSHSIFELARYFCFADCSTLGLQFVYSAQDLHLWVPLDIDQ